MRVENLFLKIISDNEQDKAECLSWFADSPLNHWLAVWMEIQKPTSNNVQQIIYRLAQLKFSEIIEEKIRDGTIATKE